MPESLLACIPLLASAEMSRAFLFMCVVLAIGMLIWDTVEVGRNDAANLVNAVFGARILPRNVAVWVAGAGVVLGAVLSSQVIDTARKGIFEPTQLTLAQAFAVYTTVYIVDTVLLYGYSAFGMPVSTTACLVFSMLGASFVLGGFSIVHWEKAGEVVSGIVCSIFIAGIAGFLIQRAVRGAIGARGHTLSTLLMHGGWAGGGMLAMLCYFMLVKGMTSVSIVKTLNERLVDPYGVAPLVLGLWALFAILIHLCLITFREKAASRLFPVLAIIGTVCMGFAFGQNDLANCAAPGLASWNLYQHQDVATATHTSVDRGLLLGCGVLLFLGMTTRNAQRVTRASVSAGSMSHNVGLWAPRWC
ncbi:MAG: inorganic phosphate transporter, partial [Phycisphaerae bacterium]|nr:inorganic phosphate transporter [Phycisphaerae bacterium]